MIRTSFLTYFTSCYGAIWILLLVAALVTQEHLDAGVFGLVGFPIISLIYAVVRRSRDANALAKQDGGQAMPPKMLEFLRHHPEFATAQDQLRDEAFHKWLNDPSLR